MPLLPIFLFSSLGVAALIVFGGLYNRFINMRLRVRRVDMRGKVVVITGANAGIGKETGLMLADFGATVILACRDLAKGDAAAQEIKKRFPQAEVSCWQLDLSSLDSVCAFAKKYLTSGNRLDVLICNAGIVSSKREVTADGHELMFQTNYLGHFLLTGLLLPALEASGTAASPSRVVVLSSEAHRFGRLHVDDLDYERRRWVSDMVVTADGQYGNTKLMNILHAKELNRRLQLRSKPVIAHSLHPGAVTTSFAVSLPLWINLLCNYVLIPLGYMKTPLEGALTSVHVATAPELADTAKHPGGEYFANCSPSYCTPDARNASLAQQLWRKAEALLGVSFLPDA